MKKTIYSFTFLAGAIGMTACSSDVEPTNVESPVAINLTATGGENIEFTTRASSAAGNSLAANSDIAVVMPGSSNTAVMQYTNTTALGSSAQNLSLKTTPAQSTPYFLKGTNEVHIYAAYPYATMAANGNVTMTVADDQSSSYTSSDLLYAKSSATKASTATVTSNLAFYHMMPKIIVNVTNNTGATITSIKLKNIRKTLTITPTSTYAFNTGATDYSYYTGKGFATSGDAGDVTVGTASGQCALIAPQTVAAHTNFIEIVTNQGTATFALGESAKHFLPGKTYTAEIAISGTSFGLTGTITDWTTADNTDLGTKILE